MQAARLEIFRRNKKKFDVLERKFSLLEAQMVYCVYYSVDLLILLIAMMKLPVRHYLWRQPKGKRKNLSICLKAVDLFMKCLVAQKRTLLHSQPHVIGRCN